MTKGQNKAFWRRQFRSRLKQADREALNGYFDNVKIDSWSDTRASEFRKVAKRATPICA